ncbi:MAG: response regulator [Lawsonibacter sp.]|jgi:two-component system response regulator YcbB|nr:response regulator [Lawsonibacter sp.]
MKIFIIEDDISVIGILEDIVEGSGLGSLCGDTGDGPPDLNQILSLNPDLILIDLLMPGKDGIQIVRELKERGCGAKFIMISQVSAKEMIAKAYTAGVEFFIQKPINLIEVRQIISNVKSQIENERALKTIQSVFAGREAPASRPDPAQLRRRKLTHILSQLGMAGEKGSKDITDLCLILLEEGSNVSQTGVSALCARLPGPPKSTEQRIRRAVERGLGHIASLGLEDYNNEYFLRYASRLFPFHEVRAEMAFQQGKGPRGRASLKKFLDGLNILVEED